MFRYIFLLTCLYFSLHYIANNHSDNQLINEHTFAKICLEISFGSFFRV